MCFIAVDATTTAKNPALAWQRDTSKLSGSKLYLFDRTSSNIQYFTTTKSHMEKCTAKNPSSSCVNFSSPVSVPNYGGTSSASGGIGVASFSNDRQLMLAYNSGDNSTMMYQILNQSGTWSEAAQVGTGTLSGATSVTAIEYPAGTVNVFSTSFPGYLVRNRYYTATKTWDGPWTSMEWSDGTGVASAWPPALAVGYTTDMTGPQLFAVMVDTHQKMRFARYNDTADNWTQFADSRTWSDYHETNYTPGLVYKPNDSSNVDVGKFYVVFSPANNGNAAIVQTIGNNPSTGSARTLVFQSNTMVINEWTTAAGETPILFNSSFDTNIRMAFSTTGSELDFWPLADGIVNIDFTDFDDYSAMSNNLAGSLAAIWP